MNGIGLSVPIYDLWGAMYLPPDILDSGVSLANRKRDRRFSVTSLLDGGVSVYDTGYAVGDRVITVRVPQASSEVAEFLAYLAETYNLITVTTEESAFVAVPGSFRMDEDGAAVLVVNLIEDIGGIDYGD